MDKKYYWIIDGKYYEATKKQYQKFKKEYDHSKMLKEYEEEVVILSLDAIVTGKHNFLEVLPDTNVNVEDFVVANIEIERLRSILKLLSKDDMYIIKATIMDDEERKSLREIGKELGISHTAVKKRKDKILDFIKSLL